MSWLKLACRLILFGKETSSFAPYLIFLRFQKLVFFLYLSIPHIKESKVFEQYLGDLGGLHYYYY